MKGVVIATGTVKWFNITNGLGFIQPDDGGPDAFLNIFAAEPSGMREVIESQKIGYDMARDSKSGKMSGCNLQAARTAGCLALHRGACALQAHGPGEGQAVARVFRHATSSVELGA